MNVVFNYSTSFWNAEVFKDHDPVEATTELGTKVEIRSGAVISTPAFRPTAVVLGDLYLSDRGLVFGPASVHATSVGYTPTLLRAIASLIEQVDAERTAK